MQLKLDFWAPLKITIPHLYTPRDYQAPLWDAMERGCRRVIGMWHRRSGKDVTAFNKMIHRAVKEVGDYYYIFPTFAQGRKVIWDATNNDGLRILNHIPEALIDRKHENEMKIRLKNGSLFQLMGSDNYDALMGTNPRGVVFSEYALHDPRAWDYIRPILTANGGWALFISTPRGKNHFWDMWSRMRRDPNWFCQSLSVEDTGVISKEDIDRDRREGMQEDMVQQEYYCSFDLGVEGSYYSLIMNQIEEKGQFCRFPVDIMNPVHTVWDIGVDCPSAIVFYQKIGREIRIVDSYSAPNKGLPHFAKVLQDKGYYYGQHIAPHDITCREWGNGLSREYQALGLGIRFMRCPRHGVHQGIDQVRAMLPFCYFNADTTQELRKALTNYRSKYDASNRTYSSTPVKDWSNHFADAFRYLAVWNKLSSHTGSYSDEELLAMRRTALHTG